VPKNVGAALGITVNPQGEAPLPAVHRCELRPEAGGPARHWQAVAERGRRFTLRNLDPGSYHLVARAGSDHLREERYYRPVEARVELVAGVETPLEIRPEVGGRLSLTTVTPEARTGVGAYCWIETARGERIDAPFAKFTDHGSTFSSGRLPECAGPALLAEILKPGQYRLHIAHADYRPVSRRLRIEAGETTTLEIALEPSH
jgi:hypothetical protein